ncbi:teichuronic acid biosynthesis glycosyltransferase TuaG [Dethiosulfatibacter aminovorans DSM 17477]|uniref:Teichuronic acid biosynthesis glycosyltransferase TuaG n=2 Tax=Dethiosulfatibacter TaxID=448125 RepID=A0A1M6LNF7_9FIRM|nr:teichuronic acid biosynthesis glycosyltransferase TuaG [Dethiosulfatibacter aminovorans DSM 17477]
MGNPLVSIVIPMYNCKKFIFDTVQSILDQTYNEYEAILVDDMSTDGTVDFIRQHIDSDDRFSIIESVSNDGAAASRNKGIEAARGKYIAFLDSDDIWHEDKLERQAEFMEKNGFAFTYTNYVKVDEEGDDLNQKVESPESVDYKKMLRANFIGCSTVMFNQEMLGKVFMPPIRKRQDYGMWLEILKRTDCGHCLEEYLMKYRVRTDSVSSNKLALVKYNWSLFREIEGLGFVKSLICLISNIFYKLFIKR